MSWNEPTVLERRFIPPAAPDAAVHVASDLLHELRREKILGGVDLARFYPELENHLLVCVTETVNKATLDRMAQVYERTAHCQKAGGRVRAESRAVGQEKA